MSAVDWNRVIMHTDADAFFASVESAFNPLLRGKPVVVGGKENQRGVVHTASYEARKRGIRTGMPLSRAKQICPEAIFLKGNYQHYQAVSDQLKAIYLRYTPSVEFTSLDDAYLDFTGTLHLYPSVEWLARQIAADVQQETGITISIGVATSKFVARVASSTRKPAGITIVPPGQEADFLAPMPVDIIHGIGPVIRSRLMEMGVFSVQQLRKIPKLLLMQLFGAAGGTFWELAHGIDPRKVESTPALSQISRETTFEEDQNNPEIILATLHYLTERICHTLHEKELVARKAGLRVRYSDFTESRMQGTLAIPSSAPDQIFGLISALFHKMNLRKIRIRLVGAFVSDLERENVQPDLFHYVNRHHALSSAIGAIRSKFGFMSILPAENLILKKHYRMDKGGFILHSPALTR